MSQAQYIERYKNNTNFNEEGDLAYTGDYSYEQAVLRQNQLFKFQQQQLTSLSGQALLNYKMIQTLKSSIIEGQIERKHHFNQLEQDIIDK